MRDNGRFRFKRAISLGGDCRPRFHLTLMLGRYRCYSGIFDNQTTPPDALMAYFRNDFRGFFERKDLEVKNDIVVNRRYGTTHPHEFKNGFTDETYAAARSKHEYLCGKMRALAGFKKTPIIFVMTHKSVPELDLELKRICGHSDFRVIHVNDPGDPDLPDGDRWQGSANAWRQTINSECEVREDFPTFCERQVSRLRRHLGFSLVE